MGTTRQSSPATWYLTLEKMQWSLIYQQRQCITNSNLYAGLAQLGEHLVYTQEVGGSSPSLRTTLRSRFINHTKNNRFRRTEPASTTEIPCSSSLVGKASGCQPEDRGFKPRLLLHVSVVQLVRTPGCGPGSQRFKSAHLPHIRQTQQFTTNTRRLFWV